MINFTLRSATADPVEGFYGDLPSARFVMLQTTDPFMHNRGKRVYSPYGTQMFLICVARRR
jgi:hypothetical protein